MIRGRILCVSGAALAARARPRALGAPRWEHTAPGARLGTGSTAEQSFTVRFAFTELSRYWKHPVGRGDGER